MMLYDEGYQHKEWRCYVKCENCHARLGVYEKELRMWNATSGFYAICPQCEHKVGVPHPPPCAMKRVRTREKEFVFDTACPRCVCPVTVDTRTAKDHMITVECPHCEAVTPVHVDIVNARRKDT
jgi:hypothetical protein